MIRWRREASIWTAIAVSFPIVALLEPGDAPSAIARAERVARWESLVGLDLGAHVASAADRLPVIGALASFVYFAAHVPAAVGMFVWLGVRRPHGYLTMRRVFVVSHLLTMACYVLLPTAPPRLVPSLGGADPSTDAGWHTLQYEFAALPSGHVIVATIVGVAMVRYAAAGAIRAVGVIYPVLIVVVTMSTRNHFVTDGLLGLVIVAVSLEAARLVAGRSWSRRPDWRLLGAGSAPQVQRVDSPFETRRTPCRSPAGSSPPPSRPSGRRSSTLRPTRSG